VLESTHAPKPALALLQAERHGLFEWSPLEEGPEQWRTEITRRGVEDGPRTVTEALEWDHDRLDALESGAFAARAAGDLALATRLFGEFARGLRRHIAFEEALLFPAFESRAGSPGSCGPTFVMRQEHREIEERLRDMECRFTNPEDPLSAARHVFHDLMHEHNVKEERMLYPATDRLLTAEERDELVSRIQAFAG
jgi:hemerythrin-like domain-containing protein